MISVNQLTETARSFIGVPYRHQGRSRKGVDCLGLIIAVGDELGIKVTEVPDYSTKVDTGVLLNGILRYAEKVPGREIKPGYLALMKFSKEAGATHTAIITERGMIHSYNKRGEVVEHRINDVWKKRIAATFKLCGVAYE